MSSQVISKELKEVTERRGITQITLSKRTFRAKTTINGYFRGDPAPIEAIEDIANHMDDSIFSQQMSFKTFKQFPPMESDVFQQHPHALDVIQSLETEQREAMKNKTMLILAKNSDALTEGEKEEVLKYVFEFLDELFIEIGSINSILKKLNLSLMSAVQRRVPHWKAQNYMKGE